MKSHSDAKIWRELRELEGQTGWPPDAIVTAIGIKLNVDEDRVRQVWRERLLGMGAG